MTNAKEKFAVAYNEKKNTQEEKTMNKAPKQKAPVEVNEAVETFEQKAESKPAVKLPKLKDEVVQDNSTWYLGREGDLSVVTNDDKNEELGVKQIRIIAPNEDQAQYNVIMNVNVTLSLGDTGMDIDLRHIEVRYQDNGTLRLNFPFRMVRGENGQNRYYDSIRLGRLITAQVLSHAHSAVDWDSLEE